MNAREEVIHKRQRKQLWLEVYVAYVAAANSTDNDEAAIWADTAIAAFDKTFANPKQPNE
jgi:hypothetical protein